MCGCGGQFRLMDGFRLAGGRGKFLQQLRSDGLDCLFVSGSLSVNLLIDFLCRNLYALHSSSIHNLAGA